MNLPWSLRAPRLQNMRPGDYIREGEVLMLSLGHKILPESILVQCTVSKLWRNSAFRDSTILSAPILGEDEFCGVGKFAIGKINLDYFVRRWRRSYILQQRELQNLATWFNSRVGWWEFCYVARGFWILDFGFFGFWWVAQSLQPVKVTCIHRCIWFVFSTARCSSVPSCLRYIPSHPIHPIPSIQR